MIFTQENIALWRITYLNQSHILSQPLDFFLLFLKLDIQDLLFLQMISTLMYCSCGQYIGCLQGGRDSKRFTVLSRVLARYLLPNGAYM